MNVNFMDRMGIRTKAPVIQEDLQTHIMCGHGLPSLGKF